MTHKYETRFDWNEVLDWTTGDQLVRHIIVDSAFNVLDDRIDLEEGDGDWQIDLEFDAEGVIVGISPEGWDEEEAAE